MRRRGGLPDALRDDTGSGSILALSSVGLVIAMVALMLGVVAALTMRHELEGAAEASALAAADVFTGVVGGYPCEMAAELASRNGATLAHCSVNAATGNASVTVTRTIAGISVSVTREAGPGSEVAGPAIRAGPAQNDSR